MKARRCVGIDVSARELAVAIAGAKGEPWEGRFANEPAGHRRLVKRLTRGGQRARVCVEATGIYHLDLCLALQAAPGIEVMVVNPRAAKDFARAELLRSKTDRVDARSLLRFVERMDFVAWQPPRPAVRELRALSRRISALTLHRAQEKNRRHADDAVTETSPAIHQSIERHLAALDAEIATLVEAALDVIARDNALAARRERLVSIKGIANASAIAILAELAVLPDDMTARQWVAHAGIDPRRTESGTSVRGHARISKVGNKHLRAALFLPALVASQHEPHVRAYYQNLLTNGKKPKQAVVAVMRKLLHAIHGMLANDSNFVGARFFEIQA